MSQELWIIFIFGLGFLVTRLVLAIKFPTPTRDQEAVFRTVLSLAAAGIAAAIPGLMNFTSQATAVTISATGALAVFALVYLLNPASPRRSSSGASDNEQSQGLGEELQPLLRRIDDLSADIKTLTKRMDQLEVNFVDRDQLRPPPPPIASPQRAWLVTTFTVGMIVLFLVYAIQFRNAAPFQATFLRIVFALLGAGVGTFTGGWLKVDSSGTRVVLRAVSALALFIIIYFLTPFRY